MPVEITFTCAWCGQTERLTVSNFTTKPNALNTLVAGPTPFPDGWTRSGSRRPSWFDRDVEGPSPIADNDAFCSDEHRKAAADAIISVGDAAWEEGRALACKLYRERLRLLILEAKGAVTALGELGEEATEEAAD